MKIKETIERDCCTTDDLKLYGGINTGKYKNLKLRFCKWCGQIYYPDSVSDGAGGRETELKKIEP